MYNPKPSIIKGNYRDNANEGLGQLERGGVQTRMLDFKGATARNGSVWDP